MNLNKLFTTLRHRKNTPAHNQQAERHKRYTHALEQFLDGQPAVRLGGAYTLTNLADEWLTDTSLPEQVRLEEAQTIIDALTGCIRTPYPLAQKRQVLESDEALEGYEGDFTGDQEALREEQLVRRTVFMELSRRLAAVAGSTEEGTGKGKYTAAPASRRRSSRLMHPSTARASPTGWGSAPHTSWAQQSSAAHALRTRQASQP